MNLIDACLDPNVFGASHFRDMDSWQAWFVFLTALFGLPLSPAQLDIYRKCTGRTEPPANPLYEAWLVCGRRGGKSFILALIAVFVACFKDWTPFLAPGEMATVMIIAQDRKQARHIMRFIQGLFNVPMLKQLVQSEQAESITLKNRIAIEIHTCSYRSVRGYTVVAALLDEMAFWQGEDASNPDFEVVTAIRPAMVTVPGAMLLCASSPRFRKGVLWDAYRKHWSKDGDPVLVWQAPTRLMNPRVAQADVDAALERDPTGNRAEYLAEWRADTEGFVTRSALEACIDFGVRERPPMHGITYVAFCDPSGGSQDSFTLAIAHYDNGIAILDCLREVKAPFQPSVVVEEFCLVIKSYGLRSVKGDHYAKEWPIEVFARHGVKYEATDKFKSDIYLGTLPLINSRTIRFLDNARMANQALDLDRSTARGGRESISHLDGSHDDLINAACGALLECTIKRPFMLVNGFRVGSDGLLINHPNPAVRSRDSTARITVSYVTEKELAEQKAKTGWGRL
jgi:hypothetical protein